MLLIMFTPSALHSIMAVGSSTSLIFPFLSLAPLLELECPSVPSLGLSPSISSKKIDLPPSQNLGGGPELLKEHGICRLTPSWDGIPAVTSTPLCDHG